MNKMFYIMKKILLTIITLFSITALNANTTDSLYVSNEQYTHEILFINTQNKLESLIQDLENLDFSMQWSINRLMIYTVDKKHRKDYNLLDAYIKHYHSCCDLFEKIQAAKTQYKNYVTTVINTGLLTENEISLFNYHLVHIESLEETVTSTLNLYKLTIIAYEDKKK